MMLHKKKLVQYNNSGIVIRLYTRTIHELTVLSFVYIFEFTPVAGTVSDIPEPERGSTVVSWSPPVPPNGIILYYNVRISNADSGELILFVEELDATRIDISRYTTTDGELTVEVCRYMNFIIIATFYLTPQLIPTPLYFYSMSTF